MKIEYLLFNFFVLFGPLFLSFLSKIPIKKPNLRRAFSAILIPAIIFIVWDFLVVDFFWYFNSEYILGFKIVGLPFEEILFFFTVPYSCLLIWENWKEVFKNKSSIFIRPILLLLILIAMIFSWYLQYTFVVLLVFLVVILIDAGLKQHLFNKLQFQSFLGIVILLTLISNAYLTARPIVLYNDLVKTNFNVGTIPVEDFIYGLALISLVTIIYSYQNKNS